MKRFKLKKLIAGPALKEMYGTVLSGVLYSNINVELNSDMFIAGQNGNLLTSPTIETDATLYNTQFFDREYSVNNPAISAGNYDLSVKPTESNIIDAVQFGNYSFNLTPPTTLATQYKLNKYRLNDNEWYREPHVVITYLSGNNISGCIIDKKITQTNIQVTQESILYGRLSGSNLVIYVKELSGAYENFAYSVPGLIPNSYLLEQPLIYSAKFARDGFVYGQLSGSNYIAYAPIATISGDSIYSPYPENPDTNSIYVNPFALKNVYNYNWNTEYDKTTLMLTGIRDYMKVGSTQGTIWTSYRYLRDNETDIDKYENVERFKGLYKYKQTALHKSNIYSIKIKNSGLNSNITDVEVKNNLRTIIETTLHNVVKRIAPANTALWKIEWEGI